MKKAIFTLVMSLAFNTFSEEAKWKIVEQIKVDLNGDGKQEELVLEIPEGWRDPGEFTRMTFKNSKGEKSTFSDLSGLPWELKNSPKNLVKSKYIFIFGNSKHPVLVFQEYAYASMPGMIQFFVMSKDGKLQGLFNKEFELEKITEKANHKIRIHGLPCGAECWGPETNIVCAYAPRLVYDVITTPEYKIVLNEAESKKRNLADGYVWHGPKYSDKIEIPVKINKNRK